MKSHRHISFFSMKLKGDEKMIIDSHAHYAHARYEAEFPCLYKDGNGYGVRRTNRNQLFEEMRKNGIVGLIEPSIGFDAIEKQMSLVSFHNEYVWGAIGVHPTRCIHTDWGKRKMLMEYAERFHPVAIGETGLDYHYPRMKQHRLRQKRWFIYQIKLADRWKLPLVLHIRDADQDALKILKKYKNKLHGGVVHCFGGDYSCAKEYILLGFALGIGGKFLSGNGTKPLEEAVKNVSLSDLLVETDAPFVLPETGELSCSKKQRQKLCNSSLILPNVIGKIADLRAEERVTVEETIYQNTLRVFRLNEEEVRKHG